MNENHNSQPHGFYKKRIDREHRSIGILGTQIEEDGGGNMIFEARNEEEAINEAIKYFKCEAKELRIVGCQHGTTKMMGMMKDQWKYDINLKVSEDPLILPKNDTNHGSISIKEGKVTVKDPVNEGTKPSISLRHPQVRLLINGKMTTRPTAIGEEDQVSFQFEEIKPTVKTQVSFSEDDLKAYITIHREEGKTFSIMDEEEALRMDVKVMETLLPAPRVTFHECISMLLNARVKESFIDQGALMRAVISKEATKVLVASGLPPIKSEKTKIAYCDEILVKEISKGLEPVVKTGTLLAKKEAKAREGVEGITVKGREIRVVKVEDEDLDVRHGAERKEDEVYALMDGRPYIKGGKIGVIPLLTFVGDLGKESENIDFDGDVVVKGHVMDQMVITATGNITIIGSIYHATLNAKQNVEIKGRSIGGRIRAGDQNAIYKVILPLAEEMLEEMDLIFQGLKMEDGKGIEDLLETIERGYHNLGDCLNRGQKLAVLLDNQELGELSQTREQIEKCFREIRLLHKEGFEDLNQLYTRLFSKVEMMREEVTDHRVVKVVYAQNTVITSSGNIIFTGKGSYQSDLSAGQEIIFEGPASVVKGGTLIAGKYIRAGVIGTAREIITYCQVLDEEGDITGRFHKGTKLMVKNKVKNYNSILP